MRTLHLLLTSFLLFVISHHPIHAQELFTHAGESPERSITEFLDEDGTFSNPDGYVGSLDSGEYTLNANLEGAPIFAVENGDTTTVWNAVGEGVDRIVNKIIVSGNDLYVGTTNYLRHFDLTDGSVQNLGGWYSALNDMILVGDDLYIAGTNTINNQTISPVIRYNIENDTWHDLGSGPIGEIFTFKVSGDDLFVGGSFRSVGGTTTNNIARYDMTEGTWHTLGNGVRSIDDDHHRVFAIEIHDDNLYVGGRFTRAEGIVANNFARYDLIDESWHAVGEGFNHYVHALTVVDHNLYVGGGFSEADGESANRIVRYNLDENTWHTLGDGVNGLVGTFEVIDNDLYIGGGFTGNFIDDGTVSRYITRYNMDSESWHPVSNDLGGSVETLASSDIGLFVGGRFLHASAVPNSRYLARWGAPRPEILSTFPEEEAVRAAVDSMISVEFNRTITAVDLNQIRIEDSEGASLDGLSASINDSTLNISHNGLENDSTYVVTLPFKSIESSEGIPNQTYSWSFHTILAPPAAELLTPADSSINVAADAVVSVLFHQDVSAVDLSGVTITNEHDDPVDGVSASLANNTLTIQHDDFPIDNEYTVTIPEGTVQNSDEVVNEPFSWSFNVPPMPGSLSLISPEDEETQVTTKPEFEWTEADDAASYVLNISADPDFEGDHIEIDDITETRYTLTTDLLYQTTYYWRVRAENSVGTSEWSDTTRFSTQDMSPPILYGPENGSKAEPPFDLAWQQVKNTDIKSSQLFISTDPTFNENVFFELGIADTLFTLEPDFDLTITNGDTLYWKVRKQLTEDELNVSEWSDTHSVIITVDAPVIVLPDPDELHELPVTLQWDADRRGENYVYDVFVHDGRTVVDSDGWLTQTQFTPNLTRTNQQYSWAVVKRSASNLELFSEWTTGEFFVKPDFVRITPDTVFTTRPSNVNIFLSARDEDGRGVTTLELDDFQLLENGRTIVEAETNLQVARRDMIDTSLKTVLLLNNSLSIGEENIVVIREAAKEFVRNKTPEQEIAIKIFAEHSELVLPFTKDENELLDALSEFRLTDTPGTDVNGSVVKALDLWEDEFSFNNINQGYLLLFTDGRDLAGTTSLNEVIEARGNKQVFAIGVQNRPEDFDEPALRQIGNAGVIIEDDFSNLIFNFLDIQQRLEQLSNSFYWFNYSSARRSSDGELNVTIAGNQNTGPDSEINVFFDASDFYGVPVDIIVNGTPENPRGVDEIFMAGDDTLGVRIETVFSFELLPFEFEISDPTKLEIDPVGDDSFIFNFIGNALDGDVIEVAIADTASPTLELEKILTVHFGERQSGPPTAALLAPSDEAEQVSLSPQFEWSEVTGAEEYRFQLSTDEAFDSFHTNTLTADTALSPEEPLQRETTYHWRVRVENPDETSRWSSSRSFTTRERAIAENLRVEVDQGQVTLRWDADPLDSDDLIEIHGGETANEMEMIAELPYDARSYSGNLDAGLLYAVSIRYADGSDSDFTNIVTFSEQSVQATPAWDLVSISIQSEQSTLSQSDLYEFSGTYSTADNLQPGKGYWVRSDENEELVVAGDGLSEATYSLRRGWNLIGALISEADAASIADPDSILTATPLFSYAGGAYAEADTLTPGRGYWLYASEDGEVTLQLTAGEEENGEGDAGSQLLAEQSVADELYRIRFSNSRATQTLFASDQPLDENLLQAYRVPPQAPAPVLDVRSGGFRITDRNSSPLQLSSEHYPVTVRMEPPRDAMESDFIYRILAVDDGSEVHYNLSGDTDIVIGKAYDELFLERVHSSEAITEFAMDQNYPNPFNPTTTIRYQLANQVDVSVIVYDILGRRVATLVNAMQQPGVYTVDFDARHLASGVYMLRIRAGSFTEIQTMTLIK